MARRPGAGRRASAGARPAEDGRLLCARRLLCPQDSDQHQQGSKPCGDGSAPAPPPQILGLDFRGGQIAAAPSGRFTNASPHAQTCTRSKGSASGLGFRRRNDSSFRWQRDVTCHRRLL
eukprot:gene14478-biopygen2083